MKSTDFQQLYQGYKSTRGSGGSINCTTRDCLRNLFNIEDYVSDSVLSSSFGKNSQLSSASSLVRNQPWVTPLIALSSLNVFIIVCFEIFVIYKAYKTTPSRRHLFLGQMLLLGLLVCSSIGFAYVPNVNLATCTITRIGLGIGYAIVFGTLLVKTVFLLSLHSGTYLPASYQALLLFFVILTQIAIEIQWLIHRKPAVYAFDQSSHHHHHLHPPPPPPHSNHHHSARLDSTGSIGLDEIDFGSNHQAGKTRKPSMGTCNHNLSSLLLSLVYDMLLIILVSCLSIKAKGHRENHKEALYISISIIASTIIWLTWIFGAIFSSEQTQDAFFAYGIVLNALFIFVVMFVPKTRQLAAMGKDCGYYCDDRDALSSPSSPSIYTPSFLHLKPTFFPLVNKPTPNWSLYKQFNGGSPGSLPVSPPQPVKTISTADRYYHMTGPCPPLAGSRMWRNSYASYGTGIYHGLPSGGDEICFYPYESSTRQMHTNPNLKGLRLPCY